MILILSSLLVLVWLSWALSPLWKPVVYGYAPGVVVNLNDFAHRYLHSENVIIIIYIPYFCLQGNVSSERKIVQNRLTLPLAVMIV